MIQAFTPHFLPLIAAATACNCPLFHPRWRGIELITEAFLLELETNIGCSIEIPSYRS
jgi:hypothetical protein